MKRFYLHYAPLEAERVTTFPVFVVGGVRWGAMLDSSVLPRTVVAAVSWAQKAGLPLVVWVECDRPKASKELIGVLVRERGTPAERIHVEDLVAHATTMAHVLLLGGSIYHLNVVFHHTEVNGLERPHSRAWEVNSSPCRGGLSCQPLV